MTTDRTQQHASAESNDSSDACITFGEYMQMLLSVTICYAEAHPEVAVSDLCMYCMSDILLTGDAPHTCPHAERRMWDQVSPQTPFLAAHLPPILPDPTATASSPPAAGGPSSSTPFSSRIVHDFNASATVNTGPAIANSCDQGVQAPDGVVCPIHGPVLTICPTHGLTTVIRAQPLEHADTGSSTSDTVAAESVTDLESIAESLSLSLSISDAPSATNSLYATPEHVDLALPTVDIGAIAPAVSSPLLSGSPAPAGIALVAPASPRPAMPSSTHAAASAPAPVAAAVMATGNTVAAPVPPRLAIPSSTHAAASAPAPVAYVTYVADPNDMVNNWYIVTRGRRVGVFNNSAQMVHSISRISGGAGRGGFHTRGAAIAAFQAALALGIVRQVNIDD